MLRAAGADHQDPQLVASLPTTFTVGQYAINSIILLDFIDITEIARAVPSRQTPRNPKNPVFLAAHENRCNSRQTELCIELQCEERKFSGSDGFSSEWGALPIRAAPAGVQLRSIRHTNRRQS